MQDNFFPLWRGTGYAVEGVLLYFNPSINSKNVESRNLLSHSPADLETFNPPVTFSQAFWLTVSIFSWVPPWLSLAEYFSQYNINWIRRTICVCVYVCLLSEVQPWSHRWHIRKKKYSKIYSHSQFPRGPLIVNWNFCLLYWIIKVAATTPRCPSVLKGG